MKSSKNVALDVLGTDDINSGLVMTSQTRSVTKWQRSRIYLFLDFNSKSSELRSYVKVE